MAAVESRRHLGLESLLLLADHGIRQTRSGSIVKESGRPFDIANPNDTPAAAKSEASIFPT